MEQDRAIYSVENAEDAKRATEHGYGHIKSWAERRKALTKSVLLKRANSRRRKGKTLEAAFMREVYRLPREEARLKAQAFLRHYPKSTYRSEVEHWRVLEDGLIEFTMRRLPKAG